MVSDCTSAVFEGLITVGNPAASWVARWQRIDNYVAGNYAMKIEGQLPDEVIQILEDGGVRYVPRDGREVEGRGAD